MAFYSTLKGLNKSVQRMPRHIIMCMALHLYADCVFDYFVMIKYCTSYAGCYIYTVYSILNLFLVLTTRIRSLRLYAVCVCVIIL